MSRYVALLYSIVLGKGKRVIMADLRELATTMGLRNARTVLATGNLIFDARKQRLSALSESLEQEFAQQFGRPIAIILRTADDWQQLLADNPFPKQSIDDPSHVTVRVMREPVTEAAVNKLKKWQTDAEQIRVVNGHLWVYFGAGIGQSKLGGALSPERMGGI
ncbi:MAG: DUF1697 domain-containing protein, partial [Woeseia sp.]